MNSRNQDFKNVKIKNVKNIPRQEFQTNMDPKSLPNLDPKLKEVYERVMQTPAPPSGGPTPPPPPTPTPAPMPPPVPPAPSAPNPNTNPIPQPPAQVFNPDVSKTVVSPEKTVKAKGKISPVIWVFAGMVFFVIYAVFWVSFFNVSLPF